MKQIQKHLKEIGAYTGEEDGLCGPLTISALKSVLKIGNDETGDMLTPHFAKIEMKCKCGGVYCDGYPVEIDMALMEMLEEIRSHYGKPVIVTSGLRCKAWNSKVGGVSNSFHLYGEAADFAVDGHTAEEVVSYIKSEKHWRECYAIDNYHVHYAY